MKYAKLVTKGNGNKELKNLSNHKKPGLKQVKENTTEYDKETERLTVQYFEEDDNYIYRKYVVEPKRPVQEPPKADMLEAIANDIHYTFKAYATHLVSDRPNSQNLALKIREFLQTFRGKIGVAYQDYKQADYQAMSLFLSHLTALSNDIDSDFEMKQPKSEYMNIINQSKNLEPSKFIQAIIDYGKTI